MFDRTDHNNDGAISRTEWRGNRDTFERLDRNNDGVIVRGELPDNEFDDEGFTRPAFSTLDRNSNGVITSGEWTRRVDEFRALDGDGDGVLTEQEYVRAATSSTRRRIGPDASAAWPTAVRPVVRTRPSTAVAGISTASESSKQPMQATTRALDRVTQYQAGYRAGFRIWISQGFRTALTATTRRATSVW